MLLASDERKQIARLFSFLLRGEQLAQDCAARQVALFDDPVSRRFLMNQARQEALHARIFKAGIGILAPRGTGEVIGARELESYHRLIEQALERGDQAETLLAMQVLFEGLGDVALTRISAGFKTRDLSFRRVRQLVVGQEDAHHGFGVRRFQQLMTARPEEWEQMQKRSETYLVLLDRIVESLCPLFEYFEEDPREYMDELQTMIPFSLDRAVA